jgi:glycosyltransferase involved in cell wall biosynthesis
VIVHNPAAARLVSRHNPDARIFEIPHFFVPPPLPEPVDTLRFRDGLGIKPRTLLAGVFGHLRESKRLTVILRAMERVWRAGANVRLLVQGEFASSDLQRALAPQLAADSRILRVGYLEPAEFWQWAAAADVCINLRYPTAAETSGIAIGMMGIGKPVIFTSGDEMARIPENACLRVDRGPAEEEMLAQYLIWLSTDREAAAHLGSRAAAHIRDHHALFRVAAQYWQALESTASAAFYKTRPET